MIEKYYVYILKSQKDQKLYTGQTQDIKRRLIEHNSGKVKSTVHRKPFDLIFCEEFNTRSQAMWREKFLKTAWGKKKITLEIAKLIPL